MRAVAGDVITGDLVARGVGRSVPRTVLLIDGNSLTYRAFFALPTDLATASGQVTNAVFGFTSMLVNIAAGPPARRDRRGASTVPSRRSATSASPPTRATATPRPTSSASRWASSARSSSRCGIPIFEVVGFEADDVIATLATQGRDAGDDVIVVTGDRDSYQLVEDPHIKVLYNKRGVSDYALYDEAGHRSSAPACPPRCTRSTPRSAATPPTTCPGVPGVGEKTAAKLITTYGGLDGIFEHLDEQTPKLRENLAAHEANVRQNHEVMVLVRDVAARPGDRRPRVRPDARSTSTRCGASSSSSSSTRCSTGWPRPSTPTSGPSASEAVVLEAEVDVDRRPPPTAARRAGRAARPATRAAGPRGGVGRATRAARRSRAWPSCATAPPATSCGCPASCSPTQACAAQLAALAGRGGRPLAAHQAKPLVRALTSLDVDVRSLALDTALAAYLLDPAESRYLLEELVVRYAGARIPDGDVAAEGQLDLEGSVHPRLHGRRPAGPSPSTGWWRRCSPPSTPRGCGRSTTTSRCRSSACWPAWRTSAWRSTATSSQAPARPARGRRRAPPGRDRRGGRARLQRQLHAAAARGALRRARPRAAEEDEDRLLHRRRQPREARRPAPDHRAPARLPRGGEAALHLRRRPAPGGRSRRPHPRHLQPDRRPHRAACRPTSRTSTTSPCAPSWAASSARRSSRPRATSSWSPTTTRSSCAASPTWPRTPG